MGHESEKVDKLEFYQRLLMQTVDWKQYPWFMFIVENDLDQKESEEIFHLLKMIEGQKEELREAGLIDMTPLLIHYVGMLNSRVDPLLTAIALNRQGYFQELTDELIQLMKDKKS